MSTIDPSHLSVSPPPFFKANCILTPPSSPFIFHTNFNSSIATEKMGSLAGEFTRKAMWLYPKVVGFNPSERWGHSSCYSHGLVYVYGGCCGGLHFRDILVLNLDTMCWRTLVTKGKGPGPRDSHSAVLWGNKMVAFGGTNGSNKVNDLHILDLESNEWTEPICTGDPPCARESHTATLVGNDKLVVFGGSGEGLRNYLNDLYVLDLKTMAWTSPAVKGDVPSPRDSHTCVAVANKLFVFGGDSGDRYHGEVYMFDVDTSTWCKLPVHGSSPGARAGHASLSIGAKIYVVGGVADKKYFNDAWCLDTDRCVWSKLDICGQAPQGRFSHSAIVAESDIVIYGGCGEDERPLRELLILQLGNEHPDGRYNVSLCKSFRRHPNQDKKRTHPREDHSISPTTMLLGVDIKVDKKEIQDQQLHPKRRRTSTTNVKTWELEHEPEEHSLSLSQHSSPSQSDQEQAPVIKPPTRAFPFWTHQSCQSPRDVQSPNNHINLSSTPEERRIQERPLPSLIGAEVQGRVDGAFDSGYLMTAMVNGRVFRGVLFSPVPGILYRRAGGMHQMTNGASPFMSSNSEMPPMVVDQPYMNPERGASWGSCYNNRQPIGLQPVTSVAVEGRSRERMMGQPTRESRYKSSDLDGVALTLGGPR